MPVEITKIPISMVKIEESHGSLISFFQKRHFGLKTKYRMEKILSKIGDIQKEYSKKVEEIRQDYILKNENGSPVLKKNEAGQEEYQFENEEKKIEFSKKLQELKEVEHILEYIKIPFEEIEKYEDSCDQKDRLSTFDLHSLKDFITEPTL